MDLDLDAVAFADGRYRLALPFKQLIEIERACGWKDADGVLHPKSVYTIFSELGAGLGLLDDGTADLFGPAAASVKDIREVMRCALIGGGSGLVAGDEIKVGPQTAVELLDVYVPHETEGWMQAHHYAWAVLDRTLRGARLKKKVTDPGDESPNPSTGEA